jgi:predicted RecB family nuclease
MEDLTVRSKTVLDILGIETVEQLVSAELPEIGTVLRRDLFFNSIRYTRKVDEELKQIIKDTIDGVANAIL